MSSFIPRNRTLQYSDTNGNIVHGGVLGSNTTTTPILTTFPTSNTGSSLGHYHYTNPADGSLKFLNASGTLGNGGHEFYTSNNTSAPSLNAKIASDGITIDRTSGGGGGTVIYSPNIAALVDGSHIDFPGGTNLHNAPYNFNQTFNPIYLTQSNGFYVSGELAYAFITNGGSQIQIFRNNNITNPIPPNTVPSDFPNTNTNGLVIGQPIFSLSLPSPPVPVTTNLNENLTLVNDTNTNTISAATIFLDDGGNNTGAIDAYSILFESATGSTVIVENNNIALSNGTYARTTNITETDIRVADNIYNSFLTSQKLTFNSVNVKMNQVAPTLIYSSPLIYADGHEPATSLAIRNTYGYSGWYFKNAPPNTAPTNKINWYFPPANPTITTVADLKGVSVSFFNGVNTSADNCLFLTILTRPTGTNDYAPGFYHSSNTYVFNSGNTPVANTNYQGVAVVSKNNVPFNYETQIQYTQSTVNNPKGTYLPTDRVLSVVIGTNSASATNAVELVVNKLNLHYDNFTQSYLLIPP